MTSLGEHSRIGWISPFSCVRQGWTWMYHKALNRILERAQRAFIFVWPRISIQLRKSAWSICMDIWKGGRLFLLHTNGTPLSEFLFEQVLKKKKKTCCRQGLIDYKIYPHRSRTQEVRKSRKLREGNPLASKGAYSQWWTKWEPPDSPTPGRHGPEGATFTSSRGAAEKDP